MTVTIGQAVSPTASRAPDQLGKLANRKFCAVVVEWGWPGRVIRGHVAALMTRIFGLGCEVPRSPERGGCLWRLG